MSDISGIKIFVFLDLDGKILLCKVSRKFRGCFFLDTLFYSVVVKLWLAKKSVKKHCFPSDQPVSKVVDELSSGKKIFENHTPLIFQIKGKHNKNREKYQKNNELLP